jgi:hypothetical protein
LISLRNFGQFWAEGYYTPNHPKNALEQGLKIDFRRFCQMDIDSLEAGPVLDALIMGKVFNEPAYPHGYTTSPYSTDIAFAWEVVEEIRKMGFIIQFWIEGRDNRKYECIIETYDYNDEYGRGSRWVSYAPTAPLAICRAALKVITP